ncbi:MAG: N-acetylmuramoyl-L-alanine amidase [Sulfurospirillum sp.]|nr:N-acetylmuramoyl-L-alanine amidase [Sulfurospirillum sp.]
MAKIASLFLFFALTCSLVFAQEKANIDFGSYDKKIQSASSDELLRVLHSLKNIYIQSIISNESDLKKDVLQRLIKASQALRLDFEHYEKELATLQKLQPSSIKQIPPKPLLEPKKEPTREPVEKKERPTITQPDVLMITDLITTNQSLQLQFNKKIDKNALKYFQLSSKNSFREVFDIKAVLSKSYNIPTPKALKDLRIAQFDPQTIRLVLERSMTVKSIHKIDNDTLFIYFGANKKLPTAPIKSITTQEAKKLLATTKTIVIDAGHGGADGGAVGYKKKVEKKAVLAMALVAQKELKKRGYKVFLTREKDKFIKLRDRTKFANDKNADIFISIHANAAAHESQYLTHKGLETYFLSKDRSERSKNVAALENQSDIDEMDYFSKQTFLNVFNREKIIAANKLALDVQQGMINQLQKNYKITDGGVREAPFWVLVGAQMPSILIEVGYITNPTEAQRLFESQYQKLLAKGVADGIDSYFLKNN